MSSIIIWRKPGMYRKGKWSVNYDVGFSFEITKYIKQEIKDICYDGLYISSILGYGDVLVITYDCKAINNNGNQKDEKIFDSIIKSLYYAVDEAKVEFCFYIEKDDTHDIPNEIYWQLDNWNDELVYDWN